MLSLYVSKLKLMQSLIQFLRHVMYVSLNTIHCSPLFPSVFGWGEATMCNKLFMQFGGCTICFGSFCVYSSCIQWVASCCSGKRKIIPAEKKAFFFCRSSVKTPVLSVAGVHEVVGTSYLGHIQCLVTAGCQWTLKLRIGKMYCVITGFGSIFRKSS